MTQNGFIKLNRLRNMFVVLMALLLFAVAVGPVMALSNAAEITDFNMKEQVGDTSITSINNTWGTVSVIIGHGTSLTSLAPRYIGVSDGATVSPGDIERDFTTPQLYIVTAEDGTTKKNWTVTATVSATQYAASILSYSILGVTGVPGGNGASYFTVTLPHGQNLSQLVGTFTVSSGATLYNSTGLQISGQTPNNFAITDSADFVVHAGDGTQQDWTVYIESGPSPEDNITAFSVPGQTGSATITSNDINTGTITVYVPYGTVRTALVPTFTVSDGATANPLSGVARDFSTTQTYTVTAEDDRYSKTWSVSVLYGTNTAANITAFTLPAIANAEPANITSTSTSTGTVTVKVPYSTSLTSVAPTFTVDDGATAAPLSGVARDFTTSQTYTVTAADGTHTKVWTVTITPLLNPSADFISYSLDGYAATTLHSVDDTHGTIEVTVPYGTPVTHMVATFTVPGGSANPTISGVPQASGSTWNDFTNYKTYHLIAPDNVHAKDWRVTVIQGTNTEANFLTYSLPGQTGSAIISIPSATVSVTVPYGTVLTHLNATFTQSPGAIVFVGSEPQISGTTLHDFGSPVLYNITAGDGIHYLNWTVNVALAPPSTAAEIATFSLSGITGTTSINSTAGTVNISAPIGTDLSSRVPTFTLSYGATASPLSGVARDFSTPQTYKVTAQDGIHTKEWVVNVNIGLKTTKVGIYKDGTWYLDMNGNGAWDGAVPDKMVTSFGQAGWTPILGDWNGDGTTKIGIYKDGTWYLDMNGNGVWDGPTTDKMVTSFGQVGWTPVLGDWNHDGTTKIGIYKDGTWYLDMNGNGVWDGPTTDKMVTSFGQVGWTPILGDWNHDGTTKIGIYKDGTWYLDMNGNGIWDGPTTDRLISPWGGSAWTPVLGDWNGDGSTKVGIYNSGSWYLDMNGNGVWDGPSIDRQVSAFGMSGWSSVTGKWS